MNDAIDELLAELEVVSMVRENGRLCMHDGKLSIESYVESKNMQAIASWVQLSIKRWWNQDSRAHTLTALQCLVMRCGSLMHDINRYPADTSSKDAQLNRLCEKCTSACVGLQNLKTTYKDDAAVMARILMLIQRLEIIMSDINDIRKRE